MAERDDRMAEDARSAQSGKSAQRGRGGDGQEGLDEALRRGNDDLAGDIESNRNLSGSTTYETLSESGDLDVASREGTDDRSGRNR